MPHDCGLRVVYEGVYDQMICESITPETSPRQSFTELGIADVAEMIALVELTQPGPFAEHTIQLGRYIGVRENGRLVAMAGERARIHGHREMSAVCTHPDARRRGLAETLVRELVTSALADGEAPFLHVRCDNDTARRLYQRTGFTVRRRMTVKAVQRNPD